MGARNGGKRCICPTPPEFWGKKSELKTGRKDRKFYYQKLKLFVILFSYALETHNSRATRKIILSYLIVTT
jgi:hypothetical protein